MKSVLDHRMSQAKQVCFCQSIEDIVDNYYMQKIIRFINMVFCVSVPSILDDYVSDEEYSPIQSNKNRNICIVDDFV